MQKFLFVALAMLLATSASAQACAGVSQWSTTANYNAGDRVVLHGILYEAASPNFCRNPCYPDQEWDRNPWVFIDTCVENCANADEYNANTEYGAYEIVKFQDKLYLALWGGNRGNRPDLNSQAWGAWKLITSCKIYCVTVEHNCVSVSADKGYVDALGRFCVVEGTVLTITATPDANNGCYVVDSTSQTITVVQDTTLTFECACDCPKFYGCDNTPLYDNSFDKVYEGCECAKVRFFDNSGSNPTLIVFCAPEGTEIRCDQQPDNYVVWQFHTICSNTPVQNYVAGSQYNSGSIVREAGICYVAKWTTSNRPSLTNGLWQDYRIIGAC